MGFEFIPPGLFAFLYQLARENKLSTADVKTVFLRHMCEKLGFKCNFFPLGSSSYTFAGKLKVTIPEDDDASKSTFYDLGLNLDKTGEVETNSETMQTFDGTFSLGPHITYVITNATLEVDKKSPVLTIEGERALQNSTSSE